METEDETNDAVIALMAEEDPLLPAMGAEETIAQDFQTCQICQDSFSDDISIKRHFKTHESWSLDENNNSIGGLLSECTLPISTVNVEVTVSTDDHKCKICGKSLSNKFCLKRHLKIHKSGRDYQCSVCLNAFKRRDNLIIHERNVHSQNSEDKVICAHCGKTFRSKKALSNHNRKHTKKYGCDVCNATFSTKFGLTRHITSHNQEKHQCPKYSKYFRQLKPHMKKMSK